MQRITSVKFSRYKAFREFSLSLDEFNILVGPNNAGKSTVLGAFRILSEAIRRARAKSATLVEGPNGRTYGYEVNLDNVPIATENIFYNYEDDQPARISFRVTGGDQLMLFFPEKGVCNLLCETAGRSILSPAAFKSHFPLEIGFVPVLGPVEHNELLYQKEAARAALLTHRASRNFRNIWYHYPERFDEFRSMIQETWPGMDIEPPEIDRSYPKPVLHMFCPEDRMPREVFWAGFGFQVWCQMLTFMVNNRSASLFIVDEPDIYLHSDLQRQLVAALRSLGPDILLATHSTEIIAEADPNEILVVTKKARSAKRVGDPSQLLPIFETLGSNLNPTLTQLARSKRVVYVEGKDFQLLSRFAAKLGHRAVATRSNFAVVQTNGFDPKKAQTFTEGVETTLSAKVAVAVVFDRDYRSDAEVHEALDGLNAFCSYAHIHAMKEIENFLLVPSAIERAIGRRVSEQAKRTGTAAVCRFDVEEHLATITDELKFDVQAQFQERRRPYAKAANPSMDDTSITAALLQEFDTLWSDFDKRLIMVPGKMVLARLRAQVHAECGVNVSTNLIIDCMSSAEVPAEMREILESLERFATRDARARAGVQV